MAYPKRTIGGGELRAEHVGQTVTLNGWAHKIRDLGGLLFVDFRDRSGIVQLFFVDPNMPGLEAVRNECCLSVTGTVSARTPETVNKKLATGEIEVRVESFEVLSPARPIPFPISDEDHMRQVNEELRIKHRYLDLRRPSMLEKLRIRASAVRRMRTFLDNKDFIEVETPIFTRSTPEGARDYLVPYRLEAGLFYALPQSPQQYKQLLMVAGIEKYYQIAKCFRDESQRSDRQPEFTQLDLEMSFIEQEDILQLIEALTLETVNGLIDEFGLEKDHVQPFTRLTYDESMSRYGCDKPDLRFGLELFDISDLASQTEFAVFRDTVENGGFVRGVVYPGGAQLSRKEVGAVEAFCKEYGAKGMASLAVLGSAPTEGEATDLGNGLFIKGPIAKFFRVESLREIVARSGANAGDLLCFIADQYAAGNNVLYRLRVEIGQRCGLRDPRKLHFGFVLDFPLVEWNAEDQRWDASHHPFTSPKAADFPLLDSDPGKVRADCYDVVCNGVEWASGSIRIHSPEIQSKVFRLLGIDEETQRSRFGHILDAFSFGPPPHGGIAPGIDRLIMFLTDDDNIREVIAFPKIGLGQDPMMGAPGPIDPQQWAELGLRRG